MVVSYLSSSVSAAIASLEIFCGGSSRYRDMRKGLDTAEMYDVRTKMSNER